MAQAQEAEHRDGTALLKPQSKPCIRSCSRKNVIEVLPWTLTCQQQTVPTWIRLAMSRLLLARITLSSCGKGDGVLMGLGHSRTHESYQGPAKRQGHCECNRVLATSTERTVYVDSLGVSENTM